MSLVRALGRAAARAIDGGRSRLALRGASNFGAGVRVFGWPRVACEGTLTVGRDVVFVATPAPVEVLVAAGAVLLIGDGALIESGTTLRAAHSVVIGRRVRIGAGCILDDDGDGAGIEIGDEAWLEDGAVLLAGAHVAAGAVVPRGAVVGDRIGSAGSPAPAVDDGAQRVVEEHVRERVRAVMSRIVPSAASVDWSADLRHSKGWDSLAALRVLVALEREFGIALPYDLFTLQPRLASLTPYVLGDGQRPVHAP